jgi:putative oxidoreductase
MTNQLSSFNGALALLGRLMLAFLFVPAGISKLTGFADTVGYIQSVGLPMPTVAAALAIVVELAGGLALVLGWQTRLAALALAGFTLVASFAFHGYWGAPQDQQFMQQLLFNKNIAVVGGLLVLAAFGAGKLSLDARRGAP